MSDKELTYEEHTKAKDFLKMGQDDLRSGMDNLCDFPEDEFKKTEPGIRGTKDKMHRFTFKHGPEANVIENPIFKEVRPELDPPKKYADDVYNEQTRILECVLQTDEYLGYLRGSEILAKLDGRYILANFYVNKRMKFIKENTP